MAGGGALGAVARSLLNDFVQARLGPDFPWGTFVINVSGSLVIGVAAVLISSEILPAYARPLLVVGFLGGYTTFSTYSNETLQLLESGQFGTATLNALGQVVLGLVAVYLGVVLARSLVGA